MRVWVVQASASSELATVADGIGLVRLGVPSYHLRPGDVLLVYQPDNDFSSCRCRRACDVVSTSPDEGLVTVDARTVDVHVAPDRHARHFWRDRPYLCLNKEKVIKYGLISIFAQVFENSDWDNAILEDAVGFVFRPDLSVPTLQPTAGYVYLLRGPVLFKIGKTVETARRRREIERDEAETLQLVHEISTNDHTRAEALLHRRYAALRRRGEWFELSEHEVAEITAISEMNF